MTAGLFLALGISVSLYLGTKFFLKFIDAA